MANLIELRKEDIEGDITMIIKNNDILNELISKNEENEKIVKKNLLSLFDVNYQSGIVKDDINGQYYKIGEEATLYIKDTQSHIKLKSMVYDTVKIMLSPPIFVRICGAIEVTSNPPQPFGINDFIIIIEEIKNIIKNNIVKLYGCQFCIYLAVITHLCEKKEITNKEIYEWLPNDNDICDWTNVIDCCEYSSDNRCRIKQNETNLCKELKKLCENGVFKEELKNKTFKINY